MAYSKLAVIDMSHISRPLFEALERFRVGFLLKEARPRRQAVRSASGEGQKCFQPLVQCRRGHDCDCLGRLSNVTPSTGFDVSTHRFVSCSAEWDMQQKSIWPLRAVPSSVS